MTETKLRLRARQVKDITMMRVWEKNTGKTQVYKYEGRLRQTRRRCSSRQLKPWCETRQQVILTKKTREKALQKSRKLKQKVELTGKLSKQNTRTTKEGTKSISTGRYDKRKNEKTKQKTQPQPNKA